jgi:hypothetical protein
MLESTTGAIKTCRRCGQSVLEEAITCPNCGATRPAKAAEGWGFEYKSDATILGLPLLHISFRYRPDRVPVPAKGIIAIGQFACGVVTISQFGLGVISLGQFTVAGYTIAQFAFAYSLLAQFGVYLHRGYGQFVTSLAGLLRHV